MFIERIIYLLMGVHDYIDFVQRNGQCVASLFFLDNDEDDPGLQYETSDQAILVMIDKKYSKADILSWHLREFAKFPTVKVTYSADDWNFIEVQGYSEILMADKEWWDQAIWESPSVPGIYLVNFEPNTYNAFVLENFIPEKIPQSYLDDVFGNRNYFPEN